MNHTQMSAIPASNFLIVALIYILIGLLALTACANIERDENNGAASISHPNILFVLTDDHAAHAVGAYGGRLADVAPTPNIDRLASEGMLFRNAFVTNAICAPSRAVILTGKHSHLNGQLTNRERFDSTQTTFPKLLQKEGYETALVGKWHLKSEPTGFDYYSVLRGQGPYYNPVLRSPSGDISQNGYTPNVIVDNALDWLQNRRNRESPFLLMLQFKAPHRNWLPGPEHLDLYDDQYLPEPSTLFDDYEGRSSASKMQRMTIDQLMQDGWDLKIPGGTGWDRLTDQVDKDQLERLRDSYADENEIGQILTGRDRIRWEYQRVLKDYLRTVASVNKNLGRVLDYLDESGLAENTIVVYTSDQGFFLGEHGWFNKRWMYEESLRIPLIVRWPGVVQAGTENTRLVQNLDFAKTFIDIAGADIPDEMQGRSLVPLLKGELPVDWRDAIYYHYYEFPEGHSVQRHYGIRTDQYKLIHYYQIAEWELFDLERDPDEMISVYDNPEYEDVREELKERLSGLRKVYAVPASDPNIQ